MRLESYAKKAFKYREKSKLYLVIEKTKKREKILEFSINFYFFSKLRNKREKVLKHELQ